MADKRSSRPERGLPAEPPRDNPDSQLRLVSPEPTFLDDEIEPNDESPTIISKLPPRSEAIANKDPNDLHGRKLAHFELLESIGVGGMAAVLRARDSQLDRIVALKILPPEMARDPENIRRFHQEARAAAKLDHENIARVFYCGEDQGLHFIAFEYVEGDNLRVILERRGHLPYGEAIRYILQIASGLEHAASRGVVHRDVKPSNIIITPNGRVAKLVDMGLARSLEPHADNGLTQSGVTLGTFDYISPEQALEPREADCRSDIYSLGCTFYHMLTGQPPVPEGTAAKKLQHHQHVAPVDPRQINPDIPDEVARILSKMMAKNVRDRYQRPIQLVQHLTQVAKASGEDLGGIPIYLDANMPVEPRRRPLLLVSLAVLALAAVLFVLSLAPQTPKKGTGAPKNAAPGQSAPIAVVPDAPPKIVAPTPVVLRTEDDLQRAINQAVNGERTTIALTSDISLSTGKLKIAGTSRWRPTIDIVATGQPVRLWLNLEKTPTAPLVGLQIDGASVNFRNVKFEIVAGDAAKRLEVPVAAVAVSGSSVVDFDQCWFAQTGLPLDVPFILRRSQGLVPAASVLVDASTVKPGGDVPKVTLRDSYFPTGQTALAALGSGKILVRDCAFHTLGALVHLKGGGEPTVSLEHCSAYLRSGPAFRIDDETACRLKVEYSLFSVPANAVRNGDEPDLLRQTDSLDKTKIVYQGQSNGYQDLNNLWVYGGSRIVTVDDLKRFRQELRQSGGDDKDSQILAKEPQAFRNEATSKSDDQIVGSFELSPSVRELQVPKDRYEQHPMLGIRHCVGYKMPPLAPLADPMPVVVEYKPAANEKVVDPDHVGAAAGYYDSLAEAMAVVRAGDVVTLKPGAAAPDFSLKPTDLEFDLTVRGFPGTQPTLTLADTRISDAYLFRLLVDTRLHLENLNLVLEPGRDGHAAQALVAMVGNGSCTIKNCVIALKPRDRANPKGIPLSVVALLDDQKMMTNEPRPAQSAANVTLLDCFLRGDGDCVTLRGSRPVNVHVTKSLLCLGGSLLHQLQSATKEIANPDAAIAVKMKDSAFFFADPLLWLQAGKAMPRFQHPLRVEQADHCLFATLGDRPLASFETPDVTEQTLPQLFEWKGQGNAYVHFDKHFLEHAPADDPLKSFHLDDAGWKETFERDGDSQFLPMGFKSLPTRPLAAATQDDAVVRAESADVLTPYLTQLPRFPRP